MVLWALCVDCFIWIWISVKWSKALIQSTVEQGQGKLQNSLVWLTTIQLKEFSFTFTSRAEFLYNVYIFHSEKSIFAMFVFNMKRSEHERHSPNCPFVKGEHTQNVPLSVTLATSPAQFPCTDGTDRIACFGSGSCPHFLAAATKRGKICIWDVSKLMKVYDINNQFLSIYYWLSISQCKSKTASFFGCYFSGPLKIWDQCVWSGYCAATYVVRRTELRGWLKETNTSMARRFI